MGLREVIVNIIGRETVSDAAKKSDSALGALSSKVGTLAKAFGALVGGVAVGKFFKDSLDEAAKAEIGMARLGNAVANAGGDFNSLRPEIEATVASVMKLSTQTDDALNEALTRMIAISGDTQGSLKNLTLVTDLAAFKQVDLETAAISVAKAMNGNTTEMNRLGVAGKNATDVLNNARASFGGFAATEAKTFGGAIQQIKNQWGEFQEAVGKAILSTGEIGSASSGLAGILGKLAQWVEKNEGSIATFTTALFTGVKAVGELASAIWDVVGPPLTWLAKVAFAGIIVSLNVLALGVKHVAGTFQEFAGTAIEALGSVVEKGGKLLKLFGIDVVAESGTAMKAFGAALKAEGTAAIDRAQKDFGTAMAKLKSGEEKHTGVVKTETAKRTSIVRKGNEEIVASHLEMDIARAKATQNVNELLQKTADLLKKQNLEQYADQWEEIDRNVRKVKGDLSDLLPPADKLKQSIEENEAAMKANAEASKANKEQIRDTVGEAVSLGRSFIDVGQAAGVLSAEAASALNSVMNMGAAIAEFGLGSVTGIISVVSGLANILAGMGDSESAKFVKDNTRALEKLTREVGNLNLSATGKAVAGTEAALQAVSAKFGGKAAFTEADGKEAIAMFRRELLKQGVSREDAEALLKELGFDNAFASGFDFLKQLPQLQQGLGSLESTQFGQDFESQMQAFQDRLDIFGLEDDKGAQLQGLSSIAKQFGASGLTSALGSADPTAALKDLFNQLLSGGLDPSAFGDLNGEQFLELIKLLLPLVGDVSGPVIDVGKEPVDKATGGLTPGKAKGGTFDPNAPITTPPRTPDDIIASLLGGSSGIAGDPDAASGLIASLLGGKGAGPGDSGLGGLLGKLGAPIIPGLEPSVPPFGKGRGAEAPGVGSKFEQNIAQSIQGDLVMQFTITPRDGQDPEEIAEIVAQRLGDRYTLQRQALGLG
jgi:hypothetical protein